MSYFVIFKFVGEMEILQFQSDLAHLASLRLHITSLR